MSGVPGDEAAREISDVLDRRGYGPSEGVFDRDGAERFDLDLLERIVRVVVAGEHGVTIQMINPEGGAAEFEIAFTPGTPIGVFEAGLDAAELWADHDAFCGE